MALPFLGEIRAYAFNFAPRGWATCAGQILPIAQNTALFSLLGTTYGGNGQTTFALPDLRGRVTIHPNNSFTLGELGGQENYTLISSEIPAHNHVLAATNAPATTADPTGGVYAVPPSPPGFSNRPYAVPSDTFASGSAIAQAGSSSAHENMEPYLTVNYCIALEGIFPSRN